MINMTINGQAVQADEGITIMEAAHRNNINIPSLCYLGGTFVGRDALIAPFAAKGGNPV